MIRDLTPNESTFMQVLAMTSLISTLSNTNFLNSDYYNNLDFGSNETNIRNILGASKLGNPATMQMFLYALLVMPKELLGATGNTEFQNISNTIDSKVKTLVSSVHTTYTGEDDSDLDSIKFSRHIRNAVAHSKCEYTVEDSVSYITFHDKLPNRNEACSIKMPTSNAGELLNELQRQLMVFLNTNLNL